MCPKNLQLILTGKEGTDKASRMIENGVSGTSTMKDLVCIGVGVGRNLIGLDLNSGPPHRWVQRRGGVSERGKRRRER